MNTLTKREEEIMDRFWKHGEMHIRELRELYDDPKPHANTLATMARILEEKGYLAHKAITSKCFKFYPLFTREDYCKRTLNSVVDKFFGKSYLGAVSTLVSEEKISVDELKSLIEMVEKNKRK